MDGYQQIQASFLIFSLGFIILSPVGKRRIHWPHGNPNADAWQLDAEAGLIVVRRNHPLVASARGGCQGWDVWIEGRYLGAVGTCSLSELAELPRKRLKSAARRACCARHQDFSKGVAASRPGWGGRRAGAGRKPKGQARRVYFSAMLDPHTLERIDRLRGAASRGEFIDRLVAAWGEP